MVTGADVDVVGDVVAASTLVVDKVEAVGTRALEGSVRGLFAGGGRSMVSSTCVAGVSSADDRCMPASHDVPHTLCVCLYCWPSSRSIRHSLRSDSGSYVVTLVDMMYRRNDSTYTLGFYHSPTVPRMSLWKT